MEAVFPADHSKTFKKDSVSAKGTWAIIVGGKLFSTPSLPSISLISEWKQVRKRSQNSLAKKHIPALRSTIWSFWHSSINPSMRLANSTTYCIASVILMAHNCHITSRCCWAKHINTHSYPQPWHTCFTCSYFVKPFFGNGLKKARGLKMNRLGSNDCFQAPSHLLQFLPYHFGDKGTEEDNMNRWKHEAKKKHMPLLYCWALERSNVGPSFEQLFYLGGI